MPLPECTGAFRMGVNALLREERQVTGREMVFINIAKFSEIVMRSQHRVRINNLDRPVIWVL